ncbi:hypothetical protein BKH41_01790 [Helicobacter sp. 12S02232-10]|nr:hypothetical protein BKH41_01790 [Helicobacter sp. 12S02232-10]
MKIMTNFIANQSKQNQNKFYNKITMSFTATFNQSNRKFYYCLFVLFCIENANSLKSLFKNFQSFCMRKNTEIQKNAG